MKCPYCSYEESKVIDSRPTDDNTSIRRRRECLECQRRFTTYEKIESIPLIVIKKDGTRETFSREKIIKGLIRACEKRPVALEQIEKIADNVEKTIQQMPQSEIPTSVIGEEIIKELKDVDEVAYVRFASVYRQFKDINSFMEELKLLLKDR